MLNGLERFQPHAYAALRAVSGFLFIFHGTRNLVGIPARAVEAGSPEFYGDLVEDIQAAQDEFAKLGECLDGLCGHDSPPRTKIREAIEEVSAAVQFFAKDRLPIRFAGHRPDPRCFAAAKQRESHQDQ